MNDEKFVIDNGRTNAARFPGRAIVIGMLIAAPWMLGSIAGWSQALLCLCGLVALAFWWLEIAVLRPKQIVIPLSVLPILLGIGLGILHFLPLPDSVASTFSADHAYQQWEELADPTVLDHLMVDRMVEFENADVATSNEFLDADVLVPPTKSISIDPNATRLMTAQLVLAAICYLLGAHFFHDRKSLTWLCIFLTVNGVAISLFGIVQKMTGEAGMIFGTIPVTGGLFGPYVNRNNAAGLLIMSLSAAVMLTIQAFADDSSSRSSLGGRRDLWYSLLETVNELNAVKLSCVFAVVFIVAGVVVSLSRGGTLSVLAGAVFTFLFLGIHGKDSRQGSLVYLFGAVIMGAALVGWLGFGEQILERFEDADRSEIMQDARVENWRDTAQLIPEQWLLGSGLSTYQHVHRPYRTTTENNLYYFAENQYFQSLMDGGVVGLTLLVLMLGWSIYFVRCLFSTNQFQTSLSAAMLGGFALSSQMVSGFFDFGLYMPANMVTFAVIMGAVAGVAQGQATRAKNDKSSRVPFSRAAALGFGPFGVALLLVLFSGGVLSLFQFYRLSRVQDQCLIAKNLLQQKWSVEPAALEQNLEDLNQLSAVRADVDVQKAITELSIAKFRLKKYQQITADQESISEKVAEDLWGRTSPAGSTLYLKQQMEINPSAKSRETAFRNDPDLKAGVLAGYHSLLKARAVSPFSVEVHLRLAELSDILTDEDPKEHLNRVLKISPMNPGYHMMVGVYWLRHINFDPADKEFEPAVAQLRKALQLENRTATEMAPLVVQRNIFGVWVYGLSPSDFAEQVLLGEPVQLERFINNKTYIPYFQEIPEIRDRIFRTAIAAASEDPGVRYWDFHKAFSMARIATAVEDWPHATQFAQVASDQRLSPNEATYVLINAFIEVGDFQAAERNFNGLSKERLNRYKKQIQKKKDEERASIRSQTDRDEETVGENHP